MRDAQILHPSLSRRGEHSAPRHSTDSGPTVLDSRDQQVLDLREQLKAELREEMKEELRAQMKAATQPLTNTSCWHQPTQLVSDEELAQFDDPPPGSVRFAPVYADGVPFYQHAWANKCQQYAVGPHRFINKGAQNV